MENAMKTYDTHQKLEAVERAVSLCKRITPSMVARGNMTRGQVSNLLDTLGQVALDYHQQALQTRDQSSGRSGLNAPRGSHNLTP
jgi:hypothetical protein